MTTVQDASGAVSVPQGRVYPFITPVTEQFVGQQVTVPDQVAATVVAQFDIGALEPGEGIFGVCLGLVAGAAGVAQVQSSVGVVRVGSAAAVLTDASASVTLAGAAGNDTLSTAAWSLVGTVLTLTVDSTLQLTDQVWQVVFSANRWPG